MFSNKLTIRPFFDLSVFAFILFLFGITLLTWSMYYSGLSFPELFILKISTTELIIWMPFVGGTSLAFIMLIIAIGLFFCKL